MSPTQLSTQCVDDDCISERGVKSLSFRSEEPRHAEGRTKKLNVFARWVSYSTNIAIAAANIATVVIPTTIRVSQELGWLCISLQSDAASKTPINKNGASTPLMTAVQKRALTMLTPTKSIAAANAWTTRSAG